jgi:hypothetical protein
LRFEDYKEDSSTRCPAELSLHAKAARSDAQNPSLIPFGVSVVSAARNCHLATRLVPFCVGPEYFDDSARAVLAKLNPSTLVKLIESLVATLLYGNLNTHGAARRVYSDY